MPAFQPKSTEFRPCAFLRPIRTSLSIARSRKPGSIALLALLLVAGSFLSSCKEQITDLGSAYFPDKIVVDSSTVTDTTILSLSNFVFSSVNSLGTTYQVNTAGTSMFIGAVNDPSSNEVVQSWGLFRFTPITGDSLNHLDSVRLLLRLVPFNYGPDTNNNLVSLSVYAEMHGRVSDSTTSISMSDLGPLVGTFSQNLTIDSSPVVAIKLDPTFFANQDLTVAAFVVIPTPGTMNTIRGFATTASTTAGFAPLLEYDIHSPDSTVSYHPTTVDYHLVLDQSTAPAGEFSLRGSLSRRELVNINIPKLNATADSVKQFSTVNSAQLVLHLDPQRTRHSASVTDTTGPAIMQLTATLASDSTPVFVVYGTHDVNDPTIYRFQVRTVFEAWLRDSTKNFGFMLGAGDVARTFGVISPHSDAVDDYSVNRWTFYSASATDPKKRPSLSLTFSILK
jgi:hypothetical protein